MSTQPCPCCGGTGRIETQSCQEIVARRRCRNRVVEDPEYYQRHPERAELRGYCGLHHNMRVRTLLRVQEHDAESVD